VARSPPARREGKEFERPCPAGECTAPAPISVGSYNQRGRRTLRAFRGLRTDGDRGAGWTCRLLRSGTTRICCPSYSRPTCAPLSTTWWPTGTESRCGSWWRERPWDAVGDPGNQETRAAGRARALPPRRRRVAEQWAVEDWTGIHQEVAAYRPSWLEHG
jgi:hypothetical protein